MPVSVLLPFRNAARTLEAAIASVLLDMTPDDELVLVDDGSIDDGLARARALVAGRPNVVVRQTGGAGVARALREGLASCMHPLVARMDADDLSLPGRLRAQRERLERDSSLAVLATRIELVAGGGRALSEGIQRFAAWQNGLLSPADHARAIFVESPVCHPSTMLRRAAVEAVGGFRDGPFAEDYDLWLRLHEAGFELAKLEATFLRWHVHDGNTTWNDPRTSIAALRRLRASYLARRLDRPFGIWGAGQEGRRLARDLEDHGARAAFFVDIDPRKVGRTKRGVRILAPDVAIARTRATGELFVLAVATRGARDLVRGRLEAEGLVELTDFVCAA